MKLLLIALFVGLVSAAPATEDKNEPLEVIVKGLPDGEPLEIGDILDIKLKETINGHVISSSDALFPFTAEGMAEQPKPEDILDPKPVVPELPVVPEPEEIVDPKPVLPELPVIPKPEEIIDPKPVVPEIPEILEPETPVAVPPIVALPETDEGILLPIIPDQPSQPEQPDMVEEGASGDLFNNGVVQVQVNAEDSGVLSSIQSWFSMVGNYFNESEQTTEQIV